VHVVTKILVVFCAVLSLLLAALTMSYSSNAGALRSGYQHLQAEKAGVELSLKDLQSSIDQTSADNQLKLENLNNQLLASDNRFKALEATSALTRTQLEQAKAAAEGVANRIALLASANDQLSQMIKSYREEVTTLRDDSLAANRREIQLTDAIRDLEGQREVLQQTARALREQLRETQVALETKAAGDSGVQSGIQHVGAPIFARVLEVGKLASGDDIVTMIEGANRDIKPNMKLNIVRDGHFIGTVIVLSVEPERSVAKVDLKNGVIQTQDQVLSSLVP